MIVLFAPIFNAGLSVSLSQAPPCMAYSFSLPPAWHCYFLFLNPISPLFLFLFLSPPHEPSCISSYFGRFCLCFWGVLFSFLNPQISPYAGLHYYSHQKNSWFWYLIDILLPNIWKTRERRKRFLCLIIFINSFISYW